ncbi:putative nuclease of restriction endonuclease-like (RecB) superfamily [Desulfitobacterium sp. LBE]|uniref:PDDEXK nuclease domain-containing protein n=1 Tax=Desulfitobacterium sp. LBE TaxID=884086 RepID=UPI0011999AF9|nr:PDDEXK nuclease domain-containing protein [Desulfitobacterium sp. LBE]TWH60309.1 putative nuclease of restriction endonuclease-like (RecB) superfamily [Desulfitobacterium sp. LBE]
MLFNNSDYFKICSDIKNQIRSAQHRAIIGANRELITLYWNIGNVINANSKWGNKFIENLARDIKLDFPDTTGFSVRNLKYMAKFSSLYSDIEFVQTVSAQLSWSHNVALLDKVKDGEQRTWYAKKTIENGWSINVMVHQIESMLYKRQVLADKTTNFETHLASPQSELAQQTLKDPYIFDFVQLRENAIERDIENQLVRNVTQLLLELGTGFAFIGNQYHMEIGGEDYYLDLLFYNLKLRCYVVIELKTGDFKPEYAGKLNFYLSAVDSKLKKEQDNSSIGILLCKYKNRLIAEYSLRDMTKPIGVSEYQITSLLPNELKDTLPSAEDIEKRVLPAENE